MASPEDGSSRERDLYMASSKTQSWIVTSSSNHTLSYHQRRSSVFALIASNSLVRAESFADTALWYHVSGQYLVDIVMNVELTSREVPCRCARSASDQVVGTGIWLGNTPTYCVQGDMTPCTSGKSGDDRIICINKYSSMLALCDCTAGQEPQLYTRPQHRGCQTRSNN